MKNFLRDFTKKVSLESSRILFQNRRDVHHYPYERFVSATSSLSSSSSRDADLLAKKE
jgi:hypothetical protein